MRICVFLKLAITLPVLAFSLWVCVISIVDVVNSVRASTWPSVTGNITHLGLVYDPIYSRGSVGMADTYHEVIEYKYSVRSVEYISNHPYFSSITLNSDWDIVKNRLSRYEVGDEISVFYSPSDPSLSVLEPKVTKSVYFSLIFGLTLTLILLVSVKSLVKE